MNFRRNVMDQKGGDRRVNDIEKHSVNNLEEPISYELLTFTVVFFLFSLFGTILIWIELESDNPMFSRFFLTQFLMISVLSMALSLVQLGRFFYKINLASTPTEEDYIPPRVYQLRGANVVDFYHLHQKFVLKDDPTFLNIRQKYQRNSAYFSFLCVMAGILIVIYLNRTDYISERPKFIVEIVVSGIVYIGVIIFFIFRLIKLSRKKKFNLQIHSLEFNEYLDKLGVNLHSNPINKKQVEIREFLELANFLQKYYQNYVRTYLKYLFNFVLFAGIGILLHFSSQSPVIFRKIGFAFILFSAIGFAINHSKFMMKRELYIMTRYILNSYFMMI